ncbi:hypothetical protein CAAN1_08S04698 [[Candida] anglica]|uniref:C2H2-type domain-containing protein n=1 Tax=[Candida] anglica TaxID=148631 RepID=A0ABP0E5V3_9ASCO
MPDKSSDKVNGSEGSTPYTVEKSNTDASGVKTGEGITVQAGSNKKKARVLGSFPCPDCSKVFTRSDHLSRHYLNHAPKEVFECDAVIEEFGGVARKCGRTFVRKDLKERHMKRHSELDGGATKRQRNNNSQTVKIVSQTERSNSISSQATIPESPFSQTQAHLQPSQQVLIQNSEVRPGNNSITPQATPSHNEKDSPQMVSLVYTQQATAATGTQNAQTSNAPYYYQNFNSNAPPTQNDILSWLFTDSPPNNMMNQANAQHAGQSINNHRFPTPQVRNGVIFDGHTPQISPAETPVPASLMFQNASPRQFTNGNNQLQPQSGNRQITQPMVSNAPAVNTQNVPPSVIPPPQGLNGSLVPPGSGLIGPNDNSLSPFYKSFSTTSLGRSMDQQLINSYGFQDVNIFSNSDNPLDEIFLKTLPENGIMSNFYSTQGNSYLPDQSATGNANFTFNMVGGSTASSSSPTTTTDSNSPRHYNNHPAPMKNITISMQERIADYAKRHNTQKNCQVFIDTLVLDGCLAAIPSLSREKIVQIFEDDGETTSFIPLEDRLSYYLSLYWALFHPQYSFIHKPTFDTRTCEPLLLLSMIIMGCNYSEFPVTVPHKLTPEFKFSLQVATPLRFMIFQHEDFKTPVKLWILQSLNILEWCEKNFLSRDMHERAHIHHGTTAQLLRRSPLLGGNPAAAKPKRRTNSGGNSTSAGEDESDPGEVVEKKSVDDSDFDLYMRWVESESMKRTTFMTFYMDIIDYIKFRHNPQILFFQLQLLHLPCDDTNLWESTEVVGSFKKIVKRQKKLQQQYGPLSGSSSRYTGVKFGESFLSALKKMLRPHSNGDHVPKSGLSPFTKKILFAGLLSIMYQMQQTEVQNTTSLLTGSDKIGGGVIGNGAATKNNMSSWKEILTKSFDNWNIDINEKCSLKQHKIGKTAFEHAVNTTQCQFPMYHLTQIIGISDLNQYDIAIFGGSPANMSVDATMKDHVIVQAKLNSMWSRYAVQKRKNISELINLKSVIHSYLLLWELMLLPEKGEAETPSNPEDSYLDWTASRDYYDSMYAVGVATLTLWSFAFTTCGLESQKFEEGLEQNENYDKLVKFSTESGHAYLYRVREEFTKYLRSDGLGEEYSIQPFQIQKSGKTPHEVLVKYTALLSRITDKQNISGLCFLVGSKLLKSQWEILRENAKLILNCGLRSIGKKTIICQDLFSNDWE